MNIQAALYSTLVVSVFPEDMSIAIRAHCASGTGGLAPGWISYTCPEEDELRYLNLLSGEWGDGTAAVAAMFQDEKPPDVKYRGEHTHHGHNTKFKQGVPSGKYQELAEFLVKERVKRQRYQALYRRGVAEIMELRNQLATWWESNDEERERMQLEYDAFVASGRVGDEPDEELGHEPAIVTPLMSNGSLLLMGHGSVNLSEPGVCEFEFVGGEGEEEEDEDEEGAPPPSKKPVEGLEW